MKRVLKIEFIILLLLATGSLAGIRSVPSDYPTIQAAIDDCNDGDVVLVAPGTYTGDGNRDIDFHGKAITVKSEDGFETCIIDCQGSASDRHRGFYFHSGEDANSVVQGFTVTAGHAKDRGGGIYCHSSSPRILDCLITGNRSGIGGGILGGSSNSVIMNCIIHSNSATYGGGIAIGGDHPIISNCTISGNHGSSYGGGVRCSGNPVFVNCVIYGNRADGSGGGLVTGAGAGNRATLQNCVVWGNTATAPFGKQIQI